MIINRQGDRQLARRIGLMAKSWRWILCGGVVCAAAAFAFSVTSPKIYRATTYLMVSQSKIGDSLRDSQIQQMELLPTFVPFVENNAVIEESLKNLQLDKAPYNLTAEGFRRRGHLDVRVLKSTRLLELSVDFPDPALAAALTNDIAQGVVRFNDTLNASDTKSSREFLRQQLDQAQEDQTRAAARRLEVQGQARIEDREKDLTILLTEKEALAKRLQQLRGDLTQNQSRSGSLQKLLADEPQIIALKRSVTSDRFVERAAQNTFADGTPLSFSEESLNLTREEIRQSLIAATVGSAAASAEIEASTARLAQIQKEIALSTDQATEWRSRLESVNQAYLLAAEATKAASREYQNASVTVSSKSQDIKQISHALVPERPVRPKVLVNTMIAFVLGTMLFGASTIAMHGYRESYASGALAGKGIEIADVRRR